MRNQPVLSVVMPVYNSIHYVGAAIESVLNQTFSNFEFIIIDDCSTDGTVVKINQYNDDRIKFIQHKSQKGICTCLNYGISIATGKYIVRMDADDISCNTRFQEQFLFMEDNPSVGVLGTWYRILGSNEIIKLPTKHEEIILDMLEYSPLAHPTVFLRKSVIDDLTTIYDQQYRYAEDYELWSRLVLKTQVENLPICLLEYRKHNNQSSSLYFLEQKLSAKRVRLKLLNHLHPDFEVDLNGGELKAFLEENGNSYKLISDLLRKIDKLLIGNLELKFFDQNLLKRKLIFKKAVIVKSFLKKQNLFNKIKFIKEFISVLTAYYSRQIAFPKNISR